MNIVDKPLSISRRSQVFDTTGYVVQLVRKQHCFFLQQIAKSGTRQVAPDVPPKLLEDGNCIPLAWARVINASGLIMAKLDEEKALTSTDNVLR